MNNVRRKQIERVIAKIEEVKSELVTIRDDEQDYYDNIPENLQGGERAMVSEEAIDYLDSAMDNLDDAIDNLNEAMA